MLAFISKSFRKQVAVLGQHAIGHDMLLKSPAGLQSPGPGATLFIQTTSRGRGDSFRGIRQERGLTDVSLSRGRPVHWSVRPPGAKLCFMRSAWM